MHYKHIFFDLDHTLWDFETNAYETIADLFDHHHLKARGVSSLQDFFERYSHHNSRLWKRYVKGYIKQDELRWKRMWLALLDYKIADEALSRQLSHEFLEQLPNQTALFPHTHELLSYLIEKGYQLHLITNGFEQVQHHKLVSSDLKKYFGEMITSEASNSLKPQKAIFDYAFKKTNATADHSIMIGDNLDADIQGGINAGIDTVFVNHIHMTDPHVPATYMVYDLESIKQIL